ncbi:PIN domain-containing protein [Azospirillum brasilense]|uniref:PIN domain-containing protein n=1 Tax=Azospirillum brasilense TaxID=192 RepID=A0A4D8QWP9_AZOBR|nr:type II toxin-antitoxin system VapC family toxin [Azospirillum brasilense]QCO15338.1 PIN domain-containing protein [Azospirillum brasilense]
MATNNRTLVDTNILLDLVTKDEKWGGWSVAQLEAAAAKGPLFVNKVIFAELSVRFDSAKSVLAMLDGMKIDFADIPHDAMFLAGKAFSQYRKAGGTKQGVLPDFFIGAHAQVVGTPLLTRDTGRFSTYFPSVPLITPTTVPPLAGGGKPLCH